MVSIGKYLEKQAGPDTNGNTISVIWIILIYNFVKWINVFPDCVQ
jgi:hypothetical protein